MIKLLIHFQNKFCYLGPGACEQNQLWIKLEPDFSFHFHFKINLQLQRPWESRVPHRPWTQHDHFVSSVTVKSNAPVVQIVVFISEALMGPGLWTQMNPRWTSVGRPPIGRGLRKSFRGRRPISWGGPMGSKRGRGRRPWGRVGLWS